jgi:RNA polymerase sigma-70 factor, ECF subfamily
LRSDLSFREALLAAIPQMRAFATSLVHNADAADDLVQETVLRAWANMDRFVPETDINAWLFTILRNLFYSSCRSARRQVPDPVGAYAARLGTPPEQNAKLDFENLREALAKLPVKQSEALLLTAAEGLSYDEAAQVCGVPTGTIKSRVNRARMRLAELLAVENIEDLGPDRLTQAVLQKQSPGSHSSVG